MGEGVWRKTKTTPRKGKKGKPSGEEKKKKNSQSAKEQKPIGGETGRQKKNL